MEEDFEQEAEGSEHGAGDVVTVTALSMAEFSRINTSYDEDLPLPRPQKRWWKKAECRHVAIEDRDPIFFPKVHAENFDTAYDEGKRFCKRCPVRKDCLEAALIEEGPRAEGLRGGLDHIQRRELWFDRRHKDLQRRKLRIQPTRSTN